MSSNNESYSALPATIAEAEEKEEEEEMASSSTTSSSSSQENSLFEEEPMNVGGVDGIEIMEIAAKIPPPLLDEADHPPSYDTAMAQEKAQRGLIGALLLKTSHVFGMHPFKAPVVCDGDVCQKRKFRDRICVPDLVLCIINLFVICNHLYLYLWACHKSSADGCICEYLKTILYIVESALPLVCVLGMMFCSYHMHNLLQTLTDAHFRVIQKRCMAKVNFWRYILYFINAFFVVGTIMELPQNFMLEIPSPSANITNMNEKPMSEMTSFTQRIFVFIDRYYFPIMNFGVVKVPQLFIMMIALRIAIMFKINAKILSKRTPSRQSLENYFSQLLDIIKVLNMLECCFNKLILAIVTTSVIKIIFTSYATLRELLYNEKFGNLGMLSFMAKAKDNEAQMDGNFFSFIITIGSTFSIFELLLNIFWTVIFIVPCIACNEFSRSALPVITGKLVPDDAKNVKDQIIQKLMDPSWGLTLGRFLKVDRAFAMTLISLIFSIVVVWVQMTVPSK